jgi:hypothetical protein
MECLQGVTGVGANDIVDLIANTAGAALGSGTAAMALQLLSRRTSTPMSPRARVITIGVTAAVLTVIAVAWFSGAGTRQQRVEDALREAFEGTNLEELERRLEEDSMAVLRIDGNLSDGGVFLDDSITYRYPATFFSLHRCVYVTWTVDSVEFRNAYGSECTVFLG